MWVKIISSERNITLLVECKYYNKPIGGVFMRKGLLTLTLALIMVAAGAFSASAATEVNLNVNGKGIPSINVLVEEGISRFSIDDFSRITGATVVWTEPDVIQISKNGKTLLLTVGERDALLDGNKVVLPRAPIRNGSVVEVPLR